MRAILVAAILIVMIAPISLAGSTVEEVNPSDMKGWGYLEETPTGAGQMMTGPETPPLGSGSASLVVDGTGGVIIGKAGYLGVRLDEITKLEYSTYRSSGGAALAIALQFNFDNDLTDGDMGWKGRLVYEPYYTHTVSTGVWQTWHPQDDAGAGNWWFTGAPGNAVCPISDPCTWSEVLAHFPDGGVHATLGAVLFKAGSGWAGGFEGNVDAFTIEVNDDGTTYDFEPLIGPPTSKQECKNGGWQQFNNPEFKNQGQCVSYVVSN